MKGMLASVIAILALALSVNAIPESSPAYFFGSQSYFAGADSVNIKATSGEELLQTLNGLTTAADAPKAIFAFGQAGLTSAAGFKALGAYGSPATLPSLKTALESSPSVTFPYSYLPSASMFRRAVPNAIASTRSFSSASTCADFTSYIETAVNAAGSRSALIIANSADEATVSVVDKCLSQITSTLATTTNDKFVTVIAGTPATDDIKTVSFLETQSSVKVSNVGAAGPGYEGPKYITGQTIFALTISFFLLIAAWVGFQCTMSIEIPFRHAQPYQLLPATKEY